MTRQICLAVVLVAAGSPALADDAPERAAKRVVLVELFTSQG
jgi:hypothetical protein